MDAFRENILRPLFQPLIDLLKKKYEREKELMYLDEELSAAKYHEKRRDKNESMDSNTWS